MMASSRPQRLIVQGIYPEVEGQRPLHWARDIGRVAEIPGVELRITSGPDVREPQVAQALRAESDVIMLFGHATKAGILVAGNKALKGRWIATQARGRDRSPRAMILAACGTGCAGQDNESLTWQIAKSGISSIGMPENVLEDAALCYVVEFVRALVAGADIGEAHDVGREAIEDQWPNDARQIVLLPGLTNGYRFIIERLNDQDQRMARLETGQEQILSLLQQPVRAAR
jgi:hypothetical protein